MHHSPVLVFRSAALAATLALTAATGAAAAEPAKPGERFRDCEDCPLLVVVPPGRFLMGADGGEDARYEGPVHEVAIGRPFAIGVYEVTNAQYRDFVEATGHRSGENCRIWDGKMPAQTPGKSWADPGYGRPPRPDEPAACISWNDATAYVEWLAARTGEPYRLPSEAEWEYVARGRAPKARFAWGDDPDAACRYANVFDRSAASSDAARPYTPVRCDDGFPIVAPVGQLEANAYGVHDIIGNVWEWVADCYVMTYLPTQTTEAAQLVHGCDRRGVRGGSWSTVVDRQRPEFRGRDPVELTTQIFGFRVARDLPAQR